MGQLYSYQQEGVSAVLRFFEKRNAAYLGDEMGLGKTIQGAEVARQILHNDTSTEPALLVICPASLRLSWVRELKKWAGLDAFPVFSRIEFADAFAHSRHIVISYDLCMNQYIQRDLLARWWSLVIFDEAHYLKSQRSLRTKFCYTKLWNRADKKLLMSGTPAPNGVIDLFTACNKCAPDVFPNYWKFGYRYTHARNNWFTGKPEFKGGKNLRELRKTMFENFFLRRLKKKVAKELPPKIFSKIPIRLEDASDLLLTPEQLSKIQDAEAVTDDDEIATRRRALGLRKIKAVADYVKEILETRQNLVVFAYHRDVLEALEDILRADFSVSVIHGGVNGKARDKAIQDFQEKQSRVFLGQISAAGTGITLTAASLAIFAELDWVPATVAQAIDRLHRIGQEVPVEVHYLLAEGTLDEQIIDSLIAKIENITKVIG